MAAGGGRELDQTPTWAVATVCVVIVVISLLLEMGIHHVGEWFTEKRKKALFEALEKIKSELMVLGFISLLITISQNYIAKICIPSGVANTMLPCHKKAAAEVAPKAGEDKRRRLLLSMIDSVPVRRILAGDPGATTCPEGKESFVSTTALHQLHIFIFFLAVFHVIYCAVMMGLGRIKIRRWKQWEQETTSLDYQFSNDPSRFRFVEDISFVKQHSSFWNKAKILLYIISFFRQFFRSVRKVDYLTMRHGFISAHLAPGSKFDFQKYIKRSLEDDFKVLVGISPVLWASAAIFLLINVYDWNTLFWVSLIPLIVILAVGTKLQAIITEMALEIQDAHAIVQGTPLVQLSDHHFWFGRPKLVLFLIHLSLFQNAFQIIYFLWIWYEFGLNSCFHENFGLIIGRVCVGVGVLILCSYVTLPLYALVSQMGTHMKRSIFDEETSKALKRWHQAVKKRRAKGSTHSNSRTPGTSPWMSPAASPARSFQRRRTFGAGSPRRAYYSDQDMSNHDEIPSASANLELVPATLTTAEDSELHNEHYVDVQDHHNNETDDFSFIKPQPSSNV